MREMRRAKAPSAGAYACMNATNVVGIRLPAAKLTGTQNSKCIPPCTAVVAVTHNEATSAYIVKRRFKTRLGDALQTRIVNAMRTIGIVNETIYAIYLCPG